MIKMTMPKKPTLIDNWRSWWRMWSVQALGVLATVLAAVAANPAPVLQFINSLPEEWKSLLPFLTFAVTFIVPTMLRVIQQPKKDAADV